MGAAHSLRTVAAALVTIGGLLVFPSVAMGDPPPNDDIQNATAVTSLPFSEAVPFSEAGWEEADPLPCLSSYPHSVWYTLTPAESGRISVSAPSTALTVDVFTGEPGSLTRAACMTYWESDFRFDAVAGTRYYILVAAAGDLTVTIDEAGPGPANDAFEDAKMIDGYDFEDTIDVSSAITPLDDPKCSDWNVQHSVWYRYTAPANATVTVGATAAFDTRVGVYRGSKGNLTQVVYCGINTFKAEQGKTYRLLVGSQTSAGGEITFSFSARKPSSITFKATPNPVKYGKRVRLTATLHGYLPGTHPTVSIYLELGLTPPAIASGPVNDKGVFSTIIRPKALTPYSARWEGDGEYLPDYTPVKVKVRVIVRGKLRFEYGHSGGYALYHSGKPPGYLFSIVPRHRPVHVRLDRYSGGWRHLAGDSFNPNRDGVALVLVNPDILVSGGRYRIRASYRGDRDHVGDHAPWSRFRVTP